jgi:quercetin dioxygenase-like cupin family protein
MTDNPPRLLRFADVPRWVWGDDTSGRVADWGYSTTERMNFIVFALGPGERWGWSENFRPAYPADEGYFVLQGELTVHNPVTGEVEVVRAGEALHFRQNTWHFGYNFTLSETLVVEALAPVPPGVSVEALERLALPLAAVRWARTELLGRWPAGAGAVGAPRTLFPMPPANWLHTLSGGHAPRRVSLFVATEHLTMGCFDVLPGQAGDPERHAGEEVLLVLAGRLTVLLPATGERFELAARDALYLPPGVSHQYTNDAAELARVLFAVAPGERAAGPQ